VVSRIGILALQGNFARHAERLQELQAEPVFVRRQSDLEGLDGLVLPGGESTTMLKLMENSLRERLIEIVRGGMPTLATCAGLILLARKVTHPEQLSFGLLDIDVSRNAYGRQVDSFVETRLTWTKDGRREIEALLGGISAEGGDREGVFIRAPRITRAGEGVAVLARRAGEPVLVRQDNILAATFHPEMSSGATLVHRLLLALCGEERVIDRAA
jgi:pyridoxal 5'-phosphate synthase pdxT subunit